MKLDASIMSETFQHSLSRLDKIIHSDQKPRIAVFGKYNHGKSTLLNAIFGYAAFKSADKRETIENLSIEHNEVMWIDTPGLDADVHGKDDAAALTGAFEMADYLFLVHQVTAGELDKYELDIFNRLAVSTTNYSQKMCLVLTQIDQKTGEELNTVVDKIQQQVSFESKFQNLTIIPLSATRYLRGIEENKPVFCEKSGISTLFDEIEKIKSGIIQTREKEKSELINKISSSVNDIELTLNQEIRINKNKQESLNTDFICELSKLITKVA
ncbi:50S ribosome-binding GTPase [Aliivibrio sp. S4TY2]|uniref:GTPase n=1 Tax=unclassified Aliivibrio TaxID=2645654 RepID=UPI002378A468|nr:MULTISPECIES: GTPase [unclassified Aliivibrio]MDD9156391.1 50S ribosome-binding GTPase [Aliivibrio sp. S4TY2]MDD9162321.1 50S ribosome-binding GTPase [Aliivibrio sp. S4TY1]MDD9164099.1 50S ribosome-binding GTPase [Aliivibrio sp. S4MY2]MDD9167928.1 50S ribosome-binding GTPase [Aliivibrio sp. S4MY4]MDD9187407.1 50S ribosome-binding GTPase [Aliivibrio sp. S4MY3]